MAKKIRVRSKRLNQIDDSKLALALWLIARGVVEDRTSGQASTSTPERESSDHDKGQA
jgi:hypothetical protein